MFHSLSQCDATETTRRAGVGKSEISNHPRCGQHRRTGRMHFDSVGRVGRALRANLRAHEIPTNTRALRFVTSSLRRTGGVGINGGRNPAVVAKPRKARSEAEGRLPVAPPWPTGSNAPVLISSPASPSASASTVRIHPASGRGGGDQPHFQRTGQGSGGVVTVQFPVQF